MADCRNNTSDRRENFVIDVNRVLDSCRDKDCYSNAKVYLGDCGRDMIERTNNIRIKNAEIVSADVCVEPVQFNRGFYNVLIRYYCKIICEGCACPGKSQEFEGMCVLDKKVILYGSEGGVSVFRSNQEGCNTCNQVNPDSFDTPETNLPVAVCEVASPVILDCSVIEKNNAKCSCTCSLDDIPVSTSCSCGCPSESPECSKMLVCTVGLFSVIRIERPAQIIVNGTEYSVPDKECCPSEESDPCAAFKCMAFPVNEFSPPTYRNLG